MVGKQEKDKRGRKEAALQVQEETGLTQSGGTETLLTWSPPQSEPPSTSSCPDEGLSQLLLCSEHTASLGCVIQGHFGFAPRTGWNLAIPALWALCSAPVEVTCIAQGPGLCSSSRAGKTAPWA